MKRNTQRDYTPAMLPGMGAPVFGGTVLTPMDTGKPYTGKVDLWSKYTEDNHQGPTLFDVGLDYERGEGRS